jgi:hypothetical protein
MTSTVRGLRAVAILCVACTSLSPSLAQVGANMHPVVGIPCDGAACHDIQWSSDNLGMYAKNVGAQRIHVHWNNTDADLAPGQTRGSLGLAIEGKPTAVYTAVPPTPVAGGSSASSGTHPTHFSIIYNFPPSPGIRDWTRSDSGVWTERYPNGTTIIIHREVGRTNLKGCPGTLVTSEPGSNDFRTYIPDKGCSLMGAWFRQGAGAWSYFGEMHDITY